MMYLISLRNHMLIISLFSINVAWGMQNFDSDHERRVKYGNSQNLEDYSDDCSIGDDIDESSVEWHEKLELGLALYGEGNYKDAAPLLKFVADENHYMAQDLYADICKNNRDGEHHGYTEAALYYLLSAYGGHEQAQAEIASLIPGIFDLKDPDRQINMIVEKWVVEKTFSVHNDYIKLLRVNSNILAYLEDVDADLDELKCNKLPYFFEYAVHFLKRKMTPKIESVFHQEIPESQPIYQKAMPKTCGEQALKPLAVDAKFVPMLMGPVHISSYKARKKEDEKKIKALQRGEQYTPKKTNLEKVTALQKKILDAIGAVTKIYSNKEIYAYTHRHYPWVLSGMKFWKLYYGEDQEITEDDGNIMRKLESMDCDISKDILEDIIISIEEKKIWPDRTTYRNGFQSLSQEDQSLEKKWKAIEDEFWEYSKKYFRSPLVLNDPFVQGVIDEFINSIENLRIDFNNGNQRAQIKVPLIMSHCKYLEIDNLDADESHYDDLAEGQRYFLYLESMTIHWANAAKKSSKTYHSLKTLFIKIRADGFVVN